MPATLHNKRKHGPQQRRQGPHGVLCCILHVVVCMPYLADLLDAELPQLDLVRVQRYHHGHVPWALVLLALLLLWAALPALPLPLSASFLPRPAAAFPRPLAGLIPRRLAILASGALPLLPLPPLLLPSDRPFHLVPPQRPLEHAALHHAGRGVPTVLPLALLPFLLLLV